MSKTVKVRIAVAVDISGEWQAFASSENCDCESADFCRSHLFLTEDVAQYWITAELPIPTVNEIPGAVEDEIPEGK